MYTLCTRGTPVVHPMYTRGTPYVRTVRYTPYVRTARYTPWYTPWYVHPPSHPGIHHPSGYTSYIHPLSWSRATVLAPGPVPGEEALGSRGGESHGWKGEGELRLINV